MQHSNAYTQMNDNYPPCGFSSLNCRVCDQEINQPVPHHATVVQSYYYLKEKTEDNRSLWSMKCQYFKLVDVYVGFLCFYRQ